MPTTIDYADYTADSWLILPIENEMGKLTEKETQKKYYFIDNGLLNFLNAEKEIDFIVPDEKLAIQVSYSIKMTQHFEEIAEIGVLNFEEFVLLDKKNFEEM